MTPVGGLYASGPFTETCVSLFHRNAVPLSYELYPAGMPVAVVYIVRHGETEENRTGVMQGQLDTPLNEVGVEQAELTASALDNVRFVRAFSSDLSRAIKVSVPY